LGMILLMGPYLVLSLRALAMRAESEYRYVR
jgi:hypothetical protein